MSKPERQLYFGIFFNLEKYRQENIRKYSFSIKLQIHCAHLHNLFQHWDQFPPHLLPLGTQPRHAVSKQIKTFRKSSESNILGDEITTSGKRIQNVNLFLSNNIIKVIVICHYIENLA